MRYRSASWLAWSLAGLSVAMFVAGVALTLLSLSGVPDTRPSSTSWGTVGGLWAVVPYLAFPLVGALIASKRPYNPIGWICLTAGLLWMFLLSWPNGSGPYPVTSAALTQWLWVPPVGMLGIYMILLFPDGKLPSRRWRPLAWFSGALIAVICVGFVFIPGPLDGYPGVRNPFGLEGQAWVSVAAYVLLPLLPLCMLASALSLVLRYRHAGGEVREQIKWVAFAASVVPAGYLIILISGLFFPPGTSLEAVEEIMVQLSFTGIPVAIGFAVLKYRLYDIDLLINRALVYGPLTILLAATYFGGVVGLQRLFSPIVGGDSGLATVATTLAIAALFNPLGRRVQAFVDRRFYRSKYDAAKILEAFGSRLQNETDVDVLRNDVIGVARTTMQPTHVSLWLRPDPGPKARSAALRQFGHDG